MEIKRFQVWLLHSDFMNVLLKKKIIIICCSNTYKVPNSKSLLMNSSSILVSTMGFSKALWTSCPIIKEVKKTNSEWNLYSHQYFRLNNVAQCPAQGKPNQSCPSRGANLMCDIWVTLLFRNIVTLGRKDNRKRRAKDSIQVRMQIMEQHQENTSSYFPVRLHWIITARGWGAPIYNWKKKWVLKITSYPFMLGSKQVIESKLRCCLTEIHFLHWYSSEFLIVLNYSKII